MVISNEDILRAAQYVETPFYMYCANALRQRGLELQAALPNIDFFYSLKANPNISVVRVLNAAGFGSEVCSLCELETSLAAGTPPERTIFVGPAKSHLEIDRAVAEGIKAIVIESVEELDIVVQAARRHDRIQSVALRINPDFQISKARLTMAGRASQFGIDKRDMQRAVEKTLHNQDHVKLTGLHVYMGTRILSNAVIAENVANVLSLADELMRMSGHRLDFVDIGGGFGVPYNDGETALDLDQLGRDIALTTSVWTASNPGTRVIMELGRYIVAEAGVFVTRVRYAKQCKGQNFAICDGGSNCHAAAGQAAAFRRNFPVSKVNTTSDMLSDWTVTGPLCTPTDVIAQDVALPGLTPGDLLRIDQSGAYGPSASPVYFLSFGFPGEVMLDGDRLIQIRQAMKPADFLENQNPLILYNKMGEAPNGRI